MEYVGRRVKKEVRGEGTFFGSVLAHEPETGVFKVVYDGGSSEELDFSAVAPLLVLGDSSSPQPSGSGAGETGSSPKKRRCIDNQGKGSDDLGIETGISDNLVDRDGNSGKFDLNLNKVLDLNDDAVNALNDDDHEIKSVGVGAELHGLDLNEEVILESVDGLGLKNEAVEGHSKAKKEFIDLNLDVNEDFENLSNGGARIPFDLNLKFPEDEITNLEACEAEIGSNESACAEVSEQRVDLVADDRKGITVDEESEMGNLVSVESEKGRLVDVENKEHSPLENCVPEVGNGDMAPLTSQKKKRGRKRKDVSNNNIPAAHALQELLEVSTETEKNNLHVENTKETPSRNGSDNDNGVSGAVMRGRRGRKRKELQDSDVTLPTPETGLRRSSRRAKRTEISEPDQVPNAEVPDVINNHLSSPAISVVSEEKILVQTHGKSGDHAMHPPKVELPPSSRELDLNGASVFDVVSVYSFLRSFSTLLFLSPFELGDFVASLKSNHSTSLFDCIHLSLLKTLRKHLESLSEEGSVSASNLLRSLNWDFLDLITWPMFLVEYLLLHSPGHIPGFVGCQLKILYDDYYQLSVSAKVDILQHLCDDVVEIEAFRLELNERALAPDRQIDLDRSVKFNSLRKRKAAKDASTSCTTDEARDPSDWNSDECSLCKMDGTLLCCDGCPASFHSRCVGVFTEDGLPPGNWYCPECSVNNENLLRGAEQLAVDPHQRVYYSSCGYLLVLELSDDKYLSRAYNQNDLPTLIEALESSPCADETLINVIREQLGHGVAGARNDLDARSSSIQSAFLGKRQILEMHPVPSETLNNNRAVGEKIHAEKLLVPSNSCNAEPENAKCDTTFLETGDLGVKIDNHLASSEGSAEVSQTFVQIDTLKESGGNYSKRYAEISDHSRHRGELANAADQYVTPISVNNEKGKNISSESCGYAPDTAYAGICSGLHRAVNFVNLYEFARTASSFYEDWTSKLSDRTPEGVPRPSEETIAKQLKVVSNRFANFSWANIQQSKVNLRKERCGWCFYCRAHVDEKKCLFVMNHSIPDIENYTCELLGIPSRENIKNHLVDVMCHILCIEDHLQGLLLGPWLNQQFSMLWRESILGASDITSLKTLLLKLESNLHHLAFSADWQKHVDTVPTVGSACHIVSSSTRLSSKHASDRKRANSSAATGLSLFWWRGGKGSRMLFNWKVLPHCLASKAARQGGCKKIQSLLYPDSGEYVKRTKCASWRAAVETSRSVQQLALQVRELDANIRWDDIGNSSLLLKIDTDSKKPVRSFKKVLIRRKSSEGGMVKYLLDFGKRRFIPDVVVKQGSMVEDASSNRKKYWLEDSHVPLHLLKSFEEKRIARKSNTVRSGKLRDSIGLIRSSFKRKGFSYLFSRAERSENYQCGHCKKDVPIRDAVSCQHCEGFFHKRHVQKSAGSITADCTYTCHKCQSGKNVKIDGRKRKFESTEHKKHVSKRPQLLRQGKGKGKGKGKQLASSKNSGKAPMAIPLRRSSRNAARIARRSLQSTKAKGRKRGRKPKSANITSKSPKKKNWKKKRMPVNSSFWLNGLWLSRRPDDVRLTHFRNTMLLVLPGEDNYVHAKPTCSLCGELEHKSELIYVACEICGVWFHGDALNLTAGSVENIIGFKCYTCLKKKPPACPHQFPTGSVTEHTGEDALISFQPEVSTDQQPDSNNEARDKH